MTPPTTGNAESAADADTPEQTPDVLPTDWLSEFAGLVFGSCTPKDVQEVLAQALDIEDTAARGLHIEMPDLEGGKLLEADPAKCVLYFESLCSLFELVVNTGDASKLSLTLAERPSLPSSVDAIKIGRVWKGITMGQVYSAKNKAKIPRHVSIPLLPLESDLQIFGGGMEESLLPGGTRQVEVPPGAAE
jgi:hypothetical protein